MPLDLVSILSGRSRLHACGHASSIEAKVVENDAEYLKGVNFPQWTKLNDKLEDPDVNGHAVIGVREYQEYAESREVLFATFPQMI